MLIKILKDRLDSIGLYEKELEVDRSKLAKHLKSEDVQIEEQAVELNLQITKVLTFIRVYKQDLIAYLDNNSNITFERYQEKFVNCDNKFFDLITEYIEKKDEFLKNSK